MFDNNAMRASRQWSTRPEDERYTSLYDMHADNVDLRNRSAEIHSSTRALEITPDPDDASNGLMIGRNGNLAAMTHHSFGQAAGLGKAPAGYLRTLPAPLASDCVNYGLHVARSAEDVQLLISQDAEGDGKTLRAITGPQYGRVWNYELTDKLVDEFGDGTSGRFRVPGEYGKAVAVNKSNTTLYRSDRDMFVFLTDEENRMQVNNRRDGQAGEMARGFFLWNSEEGGTSLGLGMFFFDFVCMNRIVWGMQGYTEKRFRHTASAPDRWKEDLAPAIAEFAKANVAPAEATIRAAQQQKIDNLDKFLASRKFSSNDIDRFKRAHEREEGKPIETIWDAVTGITAVARDMPNQDTRVALERQGGKLLDLVTV